MKTIALISCVKEKLDEPAKAIDLYQGELFTTMLEKAESYSPDAIFILSGKHHLLHPDEVIHPYDVNLDLASEIEQLTWAQTVLSSLDKHFDLQNDRFLLCANHHYRKHLLPRLANHEVVMDLDARS